MEWEARRARADLLRVLRARFPSPVPADLAAAIAELNDLDQLTLWLDAAATAASLDAFRAAVGR
jgi:hypothetical protein